MTQPFDVAKTRLQSSLFAQSVASTSNARAGIQPGQASQLSTRRLLYHFVETGSMLRYVWNRGQPTKKLTTAQSLAISRGKRVFVRSSGVLGLLWSVSYPQGQHSLPCHFHRQHRSFRRIQVYQFLHVWQWEANICTPVE